MGGARLRVGEALVAAGVQVPLLQLGIPDRFIEHGTRDTCLAAAGLDLAGLSASIERWWTPQTQVGYGRSKAPERRATPTRNVMRTGNGRDFALSPFRPFALSSFRQRQCMIKCMHCMRKTRVFLRSFKSVLSIRVFETYRRSYRVAHHGVTHTGWIYLSGCTVHCSGGRSRWVRQPRCLSGHDAGLQGTARWRRSAPSMILPRRRRPGGLGGTRAAPPGQDQRRPQRSALDGFSFEGTLRQVPIDMACWDLLGKKRSFPSPSCSRPPWDPCRPVPVHCAGHAGTHGCRRAPTRPKATASAGQGGARSRRGHRAHRIGPAALGPHRVVRGRERRLSTTRPAVPARTRQHYYYLEQPCATYDECRPRSDCDRPLVLDESITISRHS